MSTRANYIIMCDSYVIFTWNEYILLHTDYIDILTVLPYEAITKEKKEVCFIFRCVAGQSKGLFRVFQLIFHLNIKQWLRKCLNWNLWTTSSVPFSDSALGRYESFKTCYHAFLCKSTTRNFINKNNFHICTNVYIYIETPCYSLHVVLTLVT